MPHPGRELQLPSPSEFATIHVGVTSILRGAGPVLTVVAAGRTDQLVPNPGLSWQESSVP